MSEAATPGRAGKAVEPGGPVTGRRGLAAFRVAGIEVRLDNSWLLIFVLVLWSLSAGYLPRIAPEASAAARWGAGLGAALLFFASLLAHELAHALVARRAGIPVPAITLFLFGGASHMEHDPREPATELRVAAAGPLTSFALAGVFAVAAAALGGRLPPLPQALLGWLAWINLALGVFNLLPGLPLDGGRILRAAVWWRTGSIERGTRVASRAGRGLGIGVATLGALQLFSGALLGGLWLILIGLFLAGLASASVQGMVMRHALEAETVGRIMARDPVTVSPDTTLRELVDDYLLALGYRGFPVVEGGRVVGLVSLDEVRRVAPDERATARVRDHLQPLRDELCIEPEASLSEALTRMQRSGTQRLLVMRGGVLEGLLTQTGIARFLAIQQQIEDPKAPVRRR